MSDTSARAMPAADALALWERGACLHALDRCALLCAWARPDVPPDRVVEMPLGEVAATLLRLHATSFGTALDALVGCPSCGERLEVALDTVALLQSLPAPAGDGCASAAGLSLRPPTLRDLAAVAGDLDAARGARHLLARCAGVPAEMIAALDEAQRNEAEQALEAGDPAADLAVDVLCPVCGSRVTAQLDVGELLWARVEARALALLREVHTLASAYGWSEREIFDLGDTRRATYLSLLQG